MTTYIVEAYVSMRQQDAAPSYSKSKSTNQAMMTARQLLSILVSIPFYCCNSIVPSEILLSYP